MDAIVKGTLLFLCLGMYAMSADANPFTEDALGSAPEAATTAVPDSLNIPGISDLPPAPQASAPESSVDSTESGAVPASDQAVADKPDLEVNRGDTLSGLARTYLGDARRWRDLVLWNKDRYPSLVKNPNLILVGWKLRSAPPGNVEKPLPAAAVAASPSLPQTSPAASAGVPTTPYATTTPIKSIAASGSTPSQGATTPPPSGQQRITAESRVLHIGDSHTVGTYGSTMDGIMRETGAAVKTIGVAGSSPSWWWNGTVTKCGYFAKDENGRVDRPADWRTPRQTPDLQQLITTYRPTHLVVSLGANMINGSESAIKAQVRKMCEVAKANGVTLIWVGPPRGREEAKPSEKLDRLYAAMQEVVSEYGSFIDSRQYTKYPKTGGDGLHYSGTEGTAIARTWAGQVLGEIQR